MLLESGPERGDLSRRLRLEVRGARSNEKREFPRMDIFIQQIINGLVLGSIRERSVVL